MRERKIKKGKCWRLKDLRLAKHDVTNKPSENLTNGAKKLVTEDKMRGALIVATKQKGLS